MAIFLYTAIDSDGKTREGTIDAVNIDLAITAIQRRGLVISKIDPVEITQGSSLLSRISFFDRVTNEDIVMLSRQMTTLFEAQVSALRAFQLLATEARTPKLSAKLSEISADIQSGAPISTALSRHPDVFSNFYVNMVRAGEETGKLDEVFSFLADHLDRNYEIIQKARNALIYPAFVIMTFIGVMLLMMTVVVPKLADMLAGASQDIPLFTKMIIGMSNFLRHYILLLFGLAAIGGVAFYRYAQTQVGKDMIARARIQIPVVGQIYQKIFLSRIADNLSTMLKSDIQVLRAIEVTQSVVEDPLYGNILGDVAHDVKGGTTLSEAFRKHPEIPGILIAMIKIGEETGNMGKILETIARFYRREVDNSIDTMVGLIEPIMIVTLAIGVGVLLAAVLMPIYNIAASF